jgi:NAD+ diphosphatase
MIFLQQPAPLVTPAPTDLCVVSRRDEILINPEAPDRPVHEYATLPACGVDAGHPLHLGLLDGRRCWARELAPADDKPLPPGWAWAEVRAQTEMWDPAYFQAVCCARQLLWWTATHHHCGRCGTPLEDSDRERARRCPSCGELAFPSQAPAVIVAVVRDDRILLAHNRNFRPGFYSVIAGFVDPGENLEQAAAREVREETGLEITDLRYVASQPWPFPNSLMLGFTARYRSGEICVDGREIEAAEWFARDALPPIPRPGTLSRRLIGLWQNGEIARSASAG